MDLFNCKQQPKEPLSQYYNGFIQIKSQITNIPDEVVIIATIKGLRAGQCAAHLTREKPTSLAQLYEEIQKYCKSDEDYTKRIEEENNFRNQNKSSNFHPQSKTTMSEDTSPKSIKLKTAIQLLKSIFHLKINTTVSITKKHSKEVASIQEEEEDEEEEEHP
jgi:hypothetical protein